MDILFLLLCLSNFGGPIFSINFHYNVPLLPMTETIRGQMWKSLNLERVKSGRSKCEESKCGKGQIWKTLKWKNRNPSKQNWQLFSEY